MNLKTVLMISIGVDIHRAYLSECRRTGLVVVDVERHAENLKPVTPSFFGRFDGAVVDMPPDRTKGPKGPRGKWGKLK